MASGIRPANRFLRAAALTAVLTGAAGSIGLMLLAGNRNPSRLLIALFTLWVLSPFLPILWANAHWRPGPGLTRAALYAIMFVIPFGCLAIYGALASGALKAKTGFIFLVVPGACWVLIATAAAITALTSRTPNLK